MSMCRVFCYVVGRGCLLWPVRSLGKTLLASQPLFWLFACLFYLTTNFMKTGILHLGLLPQLKAAEQMNECKTWSLPVSILMHTSCFHIIFIILSRNYTFLKAVCFWCLFSALNIMTAVVRIIGVVGSGAHSRHIRRRQVAFGSDNLENNVGVRGINDRNSLPLSDTQQPPAWVIVQQEVLVKNTELTSYHQPEEFGKGPKRKHQSICPTNLQESFSQKSTMAEQCLCHQEGPWVRVVD